jgi:hypothetical protein
MTECGTLRSSTISSGPLFVPNRSVGQTTPPSLFSTYIILRNPTSLALKTCLLVSEADFPPDTGGASPSNVVIGQDLPETSTRIGPVTVMPNSSKVVSVQGTFATPPVNRIITITAQGDFEIGESRPELGLLEIEVMVALPLAGFGIGPPSLPNNPAFTEFLIAQATFTQFAVHRPKCIKNHRQPGICQARTCHR